MRSGEVNAMQSYARSCQQKLNEAMSMVLEKAIVVLHPNEVLRANQAADQLAILLFP